MTGFDPGASGGALVRSDGLLVGLVDATYTKNANIDAGVNFAISLSMFEQTIHSMRTDGVRF